MLKKITICASLLIISNVLYASPYLGISSGVMVNTSENFEIYNYGLYEHKAINYREVPLTIFAGYEFDFRGPFFIASEVFVTPVIGELNSSSWGDYANMTYNYGLSLLPSMQISEHTSAYARLGWIGAHFRNQNSNINDGQFGLGLKTSVTQHWDLRAEYSIASYSIDHPRPVVKLIPIRGSSTVNSDQFSFGLMYRFS